MPATLTGKENSNEVDAKKYRLFISVYLRAFADLFLCNTGEPT